MANPDDGTISYVTPTVLQAYLTDALRKAQIEDPKERIVIGAKGGLAYRLFIDKQTHIPTHGINSLVSYESSGVPARFIIHSEHHLAKVHSYISALLEYLAVADSFADQFGFGLVYIDVNGLIYAGFSSGNQIYRSGIGSDKIKSEKEFRTFYFDMIPSWKNAPGRLSAEQSIMSAKSELIK